MGQFVEASAVSPALSVVIPTFNNVDVLRRCLDSWKQADASQSVEIIVLEDGCSDATPDYLRNLESSQWGRRHLHWHHLDDQHELRCTNFGLLRARASLVMAWQDDMFVRSRWLVPEIIASFRAYPDLGLLCLSRGLDCVPLDEPIRTWEDLTDWRRLKSTIGARPLNWFRLQEVDMVIRPWVVRRTCVDQIGALDEAFVPTEWDESDLSFRIRQAGWKVATHGYERDGAYVHLGSTTIGILSEGYKQRVLENGRLFHQRWDQTISREGTRCRKRWWRRTTAEGLLSTVSRAARALVATSGSWTP